MGRRWGIMSCLVFMGFMAPEVSYAAGKSRTSLAVMPLQAQGGVSKETVRILENLLSAQMADYPRYKIITSKDIEGLLGFDAMKQAFDCEAKSCTAEIGGALGVAQVMNGSVSQLGNKVILTLTRIDTAKAEVLGRGSATAELANQEQLIESLRQALRTVMRQVGDTSTRGAITTLPPPGVLDWSFWAGGALTAGGAAFMWQKALAEEELSFEPDTPGSQLAGYNAPRTAKTSQLLAGVSAGLVATGLIHWFFFERGGDGQVAGATATPDGVVVTLGGAW